VFRELDRLAKPTAILASNTSGFSIAALAASTERPERVLGWHWASPPPVRSSRRSSPPSRRVSRRSRRCRGRTRLRQEPGGREGHRDGLGLRRESRLLAMLREAQRVVSEGIATRDR